MMERNVVFLEKVRQIILGNLGNRELKGKFIAQQLGMSRMQLHRKLKVLRNQNSREYITELRINHAKEQLQSTDKFIYQIAEESGFNDYSYFSKIFKKEIGYAPMCFRKRYE